MSIPRPEHPNPQWQRENWLNLNGQWEFGFDDSFGKEITVPFCPESALSGIGNTDFMKVVWYRRKIELTPEQLRGRVLLHFGAADYLATLWVNHAEIGSHEGGYTPFCFDITRHVQAGENELALCCEDDCRNPLVCSGKQSERQESHGCHYTRTTGIWQTVWLEFVPRDYIYNAVYQGDPENGLLHIKASVVGQGTGELQARALWEGREVGFASAQVVGSDAQLTLELSETHLWEVGVGGLYDLELSFNEDKVHSYFGLRGIAMDGYKFLLNGRSVFQRLVLDQGFYPDGIYTAPTAEALENDIMLSMAAGFNGARLHQKIFEPLFLYYCDKLGYLVWGEFPSWGGDTADPALLGKLLPQWCEEIVRDRNHPAIVGWCPFNETHVGQCESTLRTVYNTTKRLDPGRPCIDTSGYVHVVTDVFDVHDYEQNPSRFAAHYEDLGKGEFHESRRGCGYIPGQPVFVSEYGGIGWNTGEGWGYGKGPETEQEFKDRYEALTNVLLQNPYMFAFCYTQLTDVEQERNGVYTYEREPKFEVAFFHRVNTQKAAVEE
ncbi:MAG: beta-galactosidase [Oscillospiraceae bacterium]|nr:beta-galactosidase [Oscillospiraceae bacterium]